jgi:hypothetical protein
MKVDLALLADYAEVTQQGSKLIICGIFDRLGVGHLPVRHPHMALALKLSLHAGEDLHHRLRVRLVDPDGNDVVPPVEGNIDVRSENNQDSGVNLILNFEMVEFKAFGPHSFDVFLDGRFEQSVRLTLVEVKAPEQG